MLFTLLFLPLPPPPLWRVKLFGRTTTGKRLMAPGSPLSSPPPNWPLSPHSRRPPPPPPPPFPPPSLSTCDAPSPGPSVRRSVSDVATLTPARRRGKEAHFRRGEVQIFRPEEGRRACLVVESSLLLQKVHWYDYKNMQVIIPVCLSHMCSTARKGLHPTSL